ncbi:unnamed protein product [Didymodactylos carnosus]|uniref:Uncharacterized protein n=1 Tax=Didymodactylos carnosus TaxID=1234261 RepID=A0A814C7V7_9BILA|nr:unnamed protein product [Didymodactylos carnosus]CAF3714227.1 unnamed protein product [Didymodactylos carnosus]
MTDETSPTSAKRTVQPAAVKIENVTRRTEPGFIDGVTAPFRGLIFILGTPASWPLAAVPAIVFLLLFLLFGGLGIWLIHAKTAHWVVHTSKWVVIGTWLMRILFDIAAVLIAAVLALTIAQPVSSPALESLVRMQERALNYPNKPEEPIITSILRSVRVSIVSIIATIIIFIILTIIEIVAPPAVVITTPLKFITTGIILAWDIIDYPLSLRYTGVIERTLWFRQHMPASIGFGLAIEAIFLIPGACILLLPAGVAGATWLVVEIEIVEVEDPLLNA